MTNPNDPTPPPKKRGCFFYGCLTLVVLALIAGVAGFFIVRWAAGLPERFTDSAAVPIQVVQLSPARLDELKQRLDAFGQAIEKPQTAQELILTAEELNGLIAENKDLKGKLFVQIEGDRIKGQVSVPIQGTGWKKFDGRHLNGVAAFKVSLENGRLDVSLDSMEVKGSPVPSVFMNPLRSKNLAQDAQKDAKTTQMIEKFESIKIKDGKVILRSKGKE